MIARLRIPSIRPDAMTTMMTWSDSRLVRECLNGNEQAWAALIAKYKNLIYSVPIKYDASQADAADIFQAVCLELFTELPNLRKAESLRAWLVTVTSHKCFHWKRRQRREEAREFRDTGEEELADGPAVPPAFAEELEREQTVREAITKLPQRCQELVRLLFYEHPPLPYDEVARRLGLATGSIGFIRGRCLKRLQRTLEEIGFR